MTNRAGTPHSNLELQMDASMNFSDLDSSGDSSIEPMPGKDLRHKYFSNSPNVRRKTSIGFTSTQYSNKVSLTNQVAINDNRLPEID